MQELAPNIITNYSNLSMNIDITPVVRLFSSLSNQTIMWPRPKLLAIWGRVPWCCSWSCYKINNSEYWHKNNGIISNHLELAKGIIDDGVDFEVNIWIIDRLLVWKLVQQVIPTWIPASDYQLADDLRVWWRWDYDHEHEIAGEVSEKRQLVAEFEPTSTSISGSCSRSKDYWQSVGAHVAHEIDIWATCCSMRSKCCNMTTYWLSIIRFDFNFGIKFSKNSLAYLVWVRKDVG